MTGTEHDDDVGDPSDDAGAHDVLPLYGPPAHLPDLPPPPRRCAHLRAFTTRDGTLICRDCWQDVDWLRG